MQATSLNLEKPVTAATRTETQTPIVVTTAQFGHLKAQTGFNKLMLKNTRVGEAEQSYYSGLVYRGDKRSIKELEQAGGFLPRKQREANDSLFVADIVIPHEVTSPDDAHLQVSSRKHIHSLIATSKTIDGIRGIAALTTCNTYMIDTKVHNIYGLDADRTLQVCTSARVKTSYEVCFEDKLPFETIVGFFNNTDYTKFYPNDKYKGDFRWDSLNS